MSYTIPVERLKDPEPVYKTCLSSSDPIFVSADGKEEMVIMNINVYRNLFAKIQMYQALEEGEADIAAGREADAFEMLDRVGASVHA